MVKCYVAMPRFLYVRFTFVNFLSIVLHFYWMSILLWMFSLISGGSSMRANQTTKVWKCEVFYSLVETPSTVVNDWKRKMLSPKLLIWSFQLHSIFHILICLFWDSSSKQNTWVLGILLCWHQHTTSKKNERSVLYLHALNSWHWIR